MTDTAQTQRFPHRGGMTESIAELRPDPTLIDRIGGVEVVEQVIETLYENLMKDPLLTPIFRKSFDRNHSKMFFTEWMGGPRRYSQSPEHARGVWRMHNRFFISRPMAGRWVYYMKNALIACGVPHSLRKEILHILAPLARSLVNGGPTRPELVSLGYGDGAIQSPEYWAFERLRQAVADGERDTVMAAVEEHPDHITRRGYHGRTLLWQAADAGDLELARFLIERGAPVDMPGCLPMCTDFIHEPEAPVDGPLVPTSPHALAVWRGHDALAALLLEHGATIDVFTLAFTGDVDALRALLDERPELVHAEDPGDDFHHVTALHHAIAGGQRAAAELLIERGALVEPHSMWLLTFAALLSRQDLLELLLAHGADASRALVLGPLYTSERPMADLLVRAGADVNHHPAHGSLLVHVCRGPRAGRLERARALLAYGADPNSRGLFDNTPLHLAARARDRDLVAVLLGVGAPTRALNQHGEAPILALQTRSDEGAAPILALLHEHGADLDAVNRYGETILFAMVRQGDAAAVSWLIEHGANPLRENQRGENAHRVAAKTQRAKNAGIVEILSAAVTSA